MGPGPARRCRTLYSCSPCRRGTSISLAPWAAVGLFSGPSAGRAVLQILTSVERRSYYCVVYGKGSDSALSSLWAEGRKRVWQPIRAIAGK